MRILSYTLASQAREQMLYLTVESPAESNRYTETTLIHRLGPSYPLQETKAPRKMENEKGKNMEILPPACTGFLVQKNAETWMNTKIMLRPIRGALNCSRQRISDNNTW